MSQYGKPKELNTKPLIVCALEVETQGQLDDYDVLYTGVGKVNATYTLTSHFGKYGSHIPYDLVINYGTAGSRKIKKKTLVDCTKFVQRDMDVTGLGFMRGETPFEDDIPLMLDFGITEYNTIQRRATCGSGDNFVEDKTNYYGEVVDMEAYDLAKSKGMKIATPSKADIDAFKSASKPVYEDYKKNAGSLGAQLLDAASKL